MGSHGTPRRLATLAALACLPACSAASVPEPAVPSPSREQSVGGPDASASRAPGPAELSLLVVGDIMLSRRVAAAHRDAASTLLPLRRLLRSADVTVGNLESTLSTAGPAQQGGDSFAADPSVVPGLVDAGFDALSLANNHTGDFGPRALVRTVRQLRGSPIEPFGAGRDLREALRPAIVSSHGLRIGLLGLNAIGETPPAAPASPGALTVSMPPRTGPLDRGELRRVLSAVRRLDRRVDAVVVLPHWGTQYTHRPEPEQSLVGRRLVDAGADLVVGGHPHWVQSVERYRGAVIAHSLGNFVFDMDFMEETMQGVALRATVRKGRVSQVSFVPYRLDETFRPHRVRGAAADQVLAPLGYPR